jgi:hypothetical protein
LIESTSNALGADIEKELNSINKDLSENRKLIGKWNPKPTN